MMSITHEHLGVDPDLGRRILVRARLIAPCIDSLPDGSDARENAIAILRGVAAEAAQRAPRNLVSDRVGPMQQTYRDVGSYFSADDRASLRSLCGAAATPAPPLGSFPRSDFITRLWPEKDA